MSKFSSFLRLAKPLKGHNLNRFYLVRMLLNIFLRLLKPSYIKLGRDRLFLDRDDSLRLSILGTYEPFTTKLLKEKIHKGDNILDIGAHIGYYTLIAAQMVGEKGKVYAFEPDPQNFAILSKNIKYNNLSNVELINKAVASSSRKMKFYQNPLNAGNHSTVHNFNNRLIIIEGISLNDYFRKTPKISVIKMDIEGGEYEAIIGMGKVLKQNKKLVLFTEFWPRGLKSANRSPEKYIRLLNRFGFKMYVINEDSKRLDLFNPTFSHSYSQHPDLHVNLLGIRNNNESLL